MIYVISLKKFILLLALFATLQLNAQISEETAIKKVIAELFSGMQKFDTASIRPLFHHDVRLQTALMNPKTSMTRLQTESIDSFLFQIARLKSDTLKIEERVIGYEIKIDFPMASVWAPYEFFINDKLSHTGTDAFQLFKSTEGWIIIQICDTRKKVKRLK
ncbi:MAG: hypothetical protein Q8M15_05935 [Bacteroidota bacterium]|nr:hypothetical protein [Bacteroidota bacterium]